MKSLRDASKLSAVGLIVLGLLAVVLSAVAAMVVIGLAGRVAEPLLIVGVIVVASAVAWARVEPVMQPARVRSHHTR